jgi:L-alanine-DL-glutamate epimerase-like enolase superfamily enzyme
MRDGRIRPNSGPGIGVVIDESYLRKVTLEVGLIAELV